MKAEEKIKYILDALDVKVELNKHWYRAELYGNRIPFYRIEELSRCGFEVLNIEAFSNISYDDRGNADSNVELFVTIRKKAKKEGELNV